MNGCVISICKKCVVALKILLGKSITVKPDVLLRATLQYCNIDVQVARTKLQLEKITNVS